MGVTFVTPHFYMTIQQPRQQHWVFVNELGDNLGHISLIRALSTAARQQGIKVSFVLPDLKKAKYLNHLLHDTVLQSPTNIFSKARSKLPPATIAEGLLLEGYSQIENLGTTLQAWRSIFALLMPDCIIFDFAPTAKLATEGLATKKIAVGSPYCVYPDQMHQHNIPHRSTSTERIEKSNQKCLDAINQAFNLLSIPRLSDLSALSGYDQKYVLGHKLLDVYAQLRTSEKYLGFLNQNLGNTTKEWPIAIGKPRVFAYLSTQYPFLELLITHLKDKASLIIYITGKSAGHFERLANDACKISTTPLCMETLLSQCDAIIHHGGFSLLGQTICNKLPSLCIPLHIEQQENSRRLQEAGLGLTLYPEKTWAAQQPTVEDFLSQLKRQSHRLNSHPQFGLLDPEQWVASVRATHA